MKTPFGQWILFLILMCIIEVYVCATVWCFLQEQGKYLALPGIEKQAITSGNPTKLDTWQYKSRNQLMYVPEGRYLTISPWQQEMLTGLY